MKHLCLDIGNVLCWVDFSPFLECLSKNLNITLEEAQYFLSRTQKLHDLGCTAISDELRDHFKIKSPIIIRELLDLWNEKVIWQRSTRFEELIQKYQLNVALLSNIGFEHAKLVDSWKPFSGAIKHFSCFVGARKPSMLFYQSFLLEHPEFTGCLYVDDLQENLDASKRFGFQTVRVALNEGDYEEKMNIIEEIIVKSQST